MSRGKQVLITRGKRLTTDHRGYNQHLSLAINKEKKDGLYDIFLKSKVKFYRKCMEAGLTDPDIGTLMEFFTNKERRNTK